MITDTLDTPQTDLSVDPPTEFVSLVDLTKKKTKRGKENDKVTQLRRIAEIFDTHQHIPISKREVEKRFAISEMFAKIKFPITFTSQQDAVDKLDNAPGDLQRQVRTFFDKFSRYGLHKQEKNKKDKNKKDKNKKAKKTQEQDDDSDNVIYTFIPISKADSEAIVRPALRNIFKTDADRDGFIHSKGGKCQLCMASTDRLAIDHWRAHSVYNIDDPRIAVLLCEKCNNTHHNYDASHCIKKNKEVPYLRNWIKIEKEIRGYGFQPNEVDLNTQRESIANVNDHYCQYGAPLPDSFWEELL